MRKIVIKLSKLTKKNNLVRHCLILICALCILELSARIFIFVQYGMSALLPKNIIYAYYPKLNNFSKLTIRNDDEKLDVLILGGSTVHPYFSKINDILKNQLARKFQIHTRIYNASGLAHSTLDSLNKYRLLGNYRFDLVIIYHGINEVRTNNAPDHIFRNDYTHYAFNEKVRTLQSHPRINILSFPWALHDFVVNLKQAFLPQRYIPFHRPDENWLEFGKDIKSVVPFRSNLESMIQLANQRGEQVMLMSYAYYIPANYTQEAFTAGQLDYSPRDEAFPVEWWGNPEHVRTGIDAHNDVIQQLVDQYADVIYVHQKSLLLSSGEYFFDVCHLSQEGIYQFIQNITDHLNPSLKNMKIK